ncbi:MAG: hypothetical protein PGN13_16355 [Patulibacter minatonensis]
MKAGRVDVRFEVADDAAENLVSSRYARAKRRDVAKELVRFAKQNAPVATGAYRRSLRWLSTDTLTAALTTDIAGHLVEYGGGGVPQYAPLRRAALQLDVRFEPHSH